MFRGLDATILIEADSGIEYHDGLFYVIDEFANGSAIRRCYTPKVFFGSLMAANSAVAKWTAEQRRAADVVVEFERVYPASKIA